MKTITLPTIKSFPTTFNAEKFGDRKISNDASKFIYGMSRSSRDTATYIKGNMMSLVAVVIENSNEVVTPQEAIALLKLAENKTKRFSVNALNFEGSCYNAIAFIKF